MRHSKPVIGKITLDGYHLNVDYYLSNPFDDISVACEELPPIVEWISCQLQSIIEQKIIKGQEIKEVEGRVYFDLKNGRFDELYGAIKITEGALERAIVLDEKVMAVHREYAVLIGWVSRLQNLQAVLNMKLDLIRSSEATRRKVFSQSEPLQE